MLYLINWLISEIGYGIPKTFLITALEGNGHFGFYRNEITFWKQEQKSCIKWDVVLTFFFLIINGWTAEAKDCKFVFKVKIKLWNLPQRVNSKIPKQGCLAQWTNRRSSIKFSAMKLKIQALTLCSFSILQTFQTKCGECTRADINLLNKKQCSS